MALKLTGISMWSCLDWESSISMDGVLCQEETLKLTGISKLNCHNSVDYITVLAVALKLTGISMWSCLYWESEDGVDW